MAFTRIDVGLVSSNTGKEERSPVEVMRGDEKKMEANKKQWDGQFNYPFKFFGVHDPTGIVLFEGEVSY